MNVENAVVPTPEQIKSAVERHKQLAVEFCLESVYRSSVEAFRVYSDPHGSPTILNALGVV